MKRAADHVITFYAQQIVQMPDLAARRRAIADFEKIYNQDASARLKTEIKNRWHTRSKK